MFQFTRTAILCVLVTAATLLGQLGANAQEVRFALVIGNDEYKAAKLATPANDAGLIADALQTAGFTVTGARNLDQATLRESFREFLGQVSAAGPNAVALVYLSGFGLQFDGDNYFVPVDADIQRASDIPLQAVRVSDFTQPLAGLPGRVKIVILDAARQNPFAAGDQRLASGLALVEPVPGMAIAFNAAPGTIAPEEPGPYGAYASALTEMIATGGLGLDDLFSRLRLRVSDITGGAEVPWSVSQIDGPFFMTERTASAPPPPNVMPVADLRGKSIRDFTSVDDAYAAALERDSIDGYEQFLAIYPNSPYAARVAAMVAVRREEIIWRRCVLANTPPAYWSYLRRYPDGPHVWDARRRLAMLAAAAEPPPDFAYYDFGVPPPPPYELGYFHEPVFMFVGPRFAPPPPPPLFFLPPRPRQFAILPPPPPPRERFGLPLPAASVLPAFVRPPQSVTVRPATGATGPSGRPEFHVSLPTAVEKHGVPLTTGPSSGPGGALPTPGSQSHGGPSGTSSPTQPPSSAFVRPATPQSSPPSNGQQSPTSSKPASLQPSGSSQPPSSNGQQSPTPSKPSSLQPSGSTPPSNGQKSPAPSKPASLQPSGSSQPSSSNGQQTPAPSKPSTFQAPSHQSAPSTAPAAAHPAAASSTPAPAPHPAAPPAASHPAGCPPGKKQTPQGCK